MFNPAAKAAHRMDAQRQRQQQMSGDKERSDKAKREQDVKRQQEMVQHHHRHKAKQRNKKREQRQQQIEEAQRAQEEAAARHQARKNHDHHHGASWWKLEEHKAHMKDKHADHHQDKVVLTRPPKDEHEAFILHHGHLSGGNDIFTGKMTIEEAKDKCIHLPNCHGFTFAGQPTEDPVEVYFKSTWDFHEGTPWTSYFSVFEYHDGKKVPVATIQMEKPRNEAFVPFADRIREASLDAKAPLGEVAPLVEEETKKETKEEIQEEKPTENKSDLAMLPLKVVPIVILIVLTLAYFNPGLAARFISKEIQSTCIPLSSAGGDYAAADFLNSVPAQSTSMPVSPAKGDGKQIPTHTMKGKTMEEKLTERKRRTEGEAKGVQCFSMADEDDAPADEFCLHSEPSGPKFFSIADDAADDFKCEGRSGVTLRSSTSKMNKESSLTSGESFYI